MKQTKSQLIAKVDELEEMNGGLSDENNELQDELKLSKLEVSQLEATLERNESTEFSAFNAGFNSKSKDAVKAWLNYKAGTEL